jgi:hypothetical protein
MAKQQIKSYVLTLGAAGVSTLVVPGKVDLNQLLLITNTTRNIIYYNFADSTFTGTTVTFTRANNTTAVFATSGTNSASSGATTLTATTLTGLITVGMVVSGSANIPTGTIVTAISGTTLTLSTATTGAVSNASLTFTGESFATILQNSDGYTTITLRIDTSSHNINDSIQIFVDSDTQFVRMIGVGTDAFERTRTANPMSMLDADFEYGLQQTKWQQISMLRGYPSIYELPGTDLQVLAVVSDASNATGGTGESLVTFTTLAPHGIVAGQPVTVKGLWNYVTGFSRAEGSFVVNQVTGLNTFNYYAKAKIGATVVTATSLSNSASSGSTTLQATTSTGTIKVGMVITGSANIPAGTTALAINADIITLSAATTGAVSGASLTFTGEVVSTTYTQLRKGGFFTGANIGVPSFAVVTQSDGSTTFAVIEVTFTSNHGLLPGQTIATVITSSGSNHSFAAGPYYVESVPTPTKLRYSARAIGVITSAGLTGNVYPRPDSFYTHRPFDGGVLLGTGGPAYGAQAIRQSKKYIRYQSGKSINYNTGLLMAPNYDIRAVTASATTVGATITVVTDDVDHGLQIGAQILLSGITTSGYNGTYIVASIVDERTFTVLATSVLGATTASLDTPCLISLLKWNGSVVRAGTFDDQNGQFWQYDGQQVAVGYRSSTFQLSGVVDVTPDSNNVTQTQSASTRFQEQLSEGDRIVIKGMSHVVASIASNNSMTVTPDFRGSVQTLGAKIVKTKDFIIPQQQWNLDRCDGSNSVFNPSGYILNPNKMQMVGIAWTWYGAGFIEWQLRGPDGNYISVHRIKASNVNTEAYMRSGNQPVRYEVLNEGARTSLNGDLAAAATTIPVNDASWFPNSGYCWLEGEIIKYTGRTKTSLTGCTRAATDYSLFTGGTTRTFTAAAAQATTVNKTGIISISQTATPIISHWGSAFLQDGGFDADRGYIFNYAATNISISTKRTTAFAIRLAPSVSNSIVGDLGARDLLNRAQLLLQGIEITAGATTGSNAAIVIEGVLNPTNYPVVPTNVTWGSLQGSAAGGLPSFAQVASTTGIIFDGAVGSYGTPLLSTTVSTPANAGATTVTVASVTGAAIGDEIFSKDSAVTFQGVTRITAISGFNITFDKPLLGPLAASGLNTGSVCVTRNTSATPGETIFSFISSPSNKDALDLTPLKELVSTPIGGRGAFPNGPDVLMINVYLTQGAALTANLVLRWGEAQA